MTRIGQTFRRLKKKGRVALIPFVVIGDPDLKTTEALISNMVESGADLIELGVPFSDPFLDGLIIQAAHRRGLKNGISLEETLRWVERWKGSPFPLILTTYSNPVFQYGIKEFARDCKKGGVDGIIIPDLPLKKAGRWIDEARRMDLDTILLLAPKRSQDQIREVSRLSRGFIYYVSVEGVTGIREELPFDLEPEVRRIKGLTKKPVAVGFGISTPQQVKEISRFADGVIIGSAIVKIIEENLKSDKLTQRVGDFISSITEGLEWKERPIL